MYKYQVPTPAALETSPKPAPQSNRPKYNICKEKLKQKHFTFLHYDINSLWFFVLESKFEQSETSKKLRLCNYEENNNRRIPPFPESG